jgi:hypothetical protein
MNLTHSNGSGGFVGRVVAIRSPVSEVRTTSYARWTVDGKVVGSTTYVSFTNEGLTRSTVHRYIVQGRIVPSGNTWGTTDPVTATAGNLLRALQHRDPHR